MINKMLRTGMIAGCLAVSLVICTAVAGAEAETETAAEVSTEVAAEAVTETEAEIIPTEMTVDAFTFTNATGEDLTGEIRSRETEAESEDAETKETLADLVLTDAAAQHVFEALDFAKMSDMVITQEDGFLFIRYQNENAESRTAYETAEERTLDKPETRYITDTVYIHAEADLDSAKIGSVKLGDEVEVTAVLPRALKVTAGEKEGYVSRKYVSPSKEDAETAVQAEKYARAQIEAAAAAAAARAQAQAAASQAASSSSGHKSSSKKKSSGRTIVSRENLDNCDGSGHGVTVITYSDGSVETKDY